MRVRTAVEYIVGSRRAILEVASDRRALGIGALLVLSAALARNYDRVSLIHEPWRLLGPFAASLAISGPLFLVVYGFARGKGMSGPGIVRAYLSFLALYWMTAPLAWLYGIPYERFCTPLRAIDANLWTLALVSLWRVALMVRVVTVIFNLPLNAALPLVMLVADTAALVALFLVPLPVIHVMGGISPEQSEIAGIAFLVTGACIVTLPFWLVLALAPIRKRDICPEWRVPPSADQEGGSYGVLAFTVAVLAGWSATLPFTQPEQLLARRADEIYRRAGQAAALDFMSAHKRAEFPPGWEPPPRRFPGEPPISEVLDSLATLADRPHAEWVCDRACERFRDRARYHLYERPDELIGENAAHLAAILTRFHRGRELAQALDDRYYPIEIRVSDPDKLTDEQRAAIKTLRQLAGESQDKPPANQPPRRPDDPWQ